MSLPLPAWIPAWQVWDIQSGRIIRDGWHHNGRITGLEFNQVEFLMVSSGADRTVRVWDLEVWQQVECLGPEATAVQSIAYAQDGSVLLTATADALKVWGLEPTVHHDTVPMDWRNLADLHLYYKDGHPRALGCCCSGSSVGTFMVDLRKVEPFCSTGSQAAAGGIGSGGLAQLHSSIKGPAAGTALDDVHTPAQQQSHQLMVPQQQRRSESSVDRDSVDRQQGILSLMCEAAVAGSPQQEDMSTAGPLTRQLPRQRTPPRPAAPAGLKGSSSRQAGSCLVQAASPAARRVLQPHPSPAAASSPHHTTQQQQQQQQQHEPKGSDYFPEVEIRVPAGRPPPVVAEQPAASTLVPVQSTSRSKQHTIANGSGPASAGVSVGRLQPSSSSSRRTLGLDSDAAAAAQLSAGMTSMALQEAHAAPRQPTQQQQQQPEVSRSNSSSSRAKEPPGALSATLTAWLSDLPASAPEACSAAPSKSSSRSSSMPASRAPSRRDMSSSQPQQPGPAAAAPVVVDPILAAMATRPRLDTELARMVSALQVAKGFAARGNLEGAYKAALSHGDAAVACMLLDAVSSRADAFELNSLEPLVKLLELLLSSGQSEQVAVGLSVLGLVLRGPGQMVHDVCSAPKPPGVDLSFEARHSKCLLLKMALEGLGMKLGVLSRSQGPVATRAQLLAEELKRVVTAGP